LRTLFPLTVSRSRLARRPGRVLLVGLGVAAGAAALAGVLGGSLVTRDRSLSRAIDRLPGEQRAVRAVWGGEPGQVGGRWASLDRAARPELRTLGLGEPFAATLFRESEIDGYLVTLGGVEHLRRWVRLSSGRLPRPCRAARCEVVQLAGHGPIPNVPGLRLVVVGRGSLSSALPIENFISRDLVGSILAEALRYHTAALPPFLLAEGVQGIASAPALADTYRGYDWVVPLRGGSLHPWTTSSFARAVTQVRSDFEAGSEFFDLLAPVEEVQAADASSRVAGRRLLLIGGQAAALLLAFTVLAAASLRRDVEASWRRLTWAGARRSQLLTAAAGEWGAVAALGTVIGWGVGTGAAAVIADRAGSPPGAVVAHSLVSGWGLGVAAALAVGIAVVLLLGLRAPAMRLGGLSISLVDVAALGALVAIVLSFARGSTNAGDLAAQGGTGAVLILLPALVAFVAAVVCARALAPALRLLGRIGARGPVPVRLAALSLARNPGRAAVAVTFLVVSLGLALFAETYRGTLVRGQHDQAAFAVPRDLLASEDLTKLVPVTEAAPQSAYARLGDAQMVVREDGDVSRLTNSAGFTLLGIPAGAIPTINGWRGDFSHSSLPELARRVTPVDSKAMRGVRLPADARELTWPASITGGYLRFRAYVLTRRGDYTSFLIGQLARSPGVLRARVPSVARGGLLTTLGLELANYELHDLANAGINVERRAVGVLRLGTLRMDGRALRVPWADWIGVTGVQPLGAGVAHYHVNGSLDSYLRARQPTDGAPVPVVTTPAIAAAAGRGGVLPVDITGQQLLTRVVGVAKRFPSVDGDFIFADRQTVATALNAGVPGSGVANEVWIDTRPGVDAEAAVARPPLSALAVASRSAYAADLESDPLARGSLLTLAVAALAALLLALVGLVLGVVADLRDESGELLDLEAQGADPAMLRRHLRLRALLVGIFGVAGGIATGAAMSALVVDLVALTANATSPEPPLQLALDWRLLLLGLAGYLVLAVALVGLATWRLRLAEARPVAEVGA
jgi:hypothetical protein